MEGTKMKRILMWAGLATAVAVPVILLLNKGRKSKKEGEEPVLFYRDINNIFEEEMK